MMAKIEIICAECGQPAVKERGGVNRSLRKGSPIFCGKTCFGISRRKHKTEFEKKAEKSAYDRRRREELRDELRAKKREHHRRTYDPLKAAEYRKSRMHKHIEYCRRPEYRKWKAEYDKKYLAQKNYGEFGDCFLLLQKLQAEIYSHQSKQEIDTQLGRIGKSTRRKRDYERPYSNQPETGPLGNPG